MGDCLEKEMLAASGMQLLYHDHAKIYHNENSEDF